VLGHLPSKLDTLSSNPRTHQEKKKKSTLNKTKLPEFKVITTLLATSGLSPKLGQIIRLSLNKQHLHTCEKEL
jgi:hypothetical protein